MNLNYTIYLFIPIFRIADEEGPIKIKLLFSHNWANSAFSDKNPYPGCTAWHPVSFATSTMRSCFK